MSIQKHIQQNSKMPEIMDTLGWCRGFVFGPLSEKMLENAIEFCFKNKMPLDSLPVSARTARLIELVYITPGTMKQEWKKFYRLFRWFRKRYPSTDLWYMGSLCCVQIIVGKYAYGMGRIKCAEKLYFRPRLLMSRRTKLLEEREELLEKND